MEEHPQARTIVETLVSAGFIAYYAGGWVRDLLLGHPSDDIDIATDAPPETVQALFPKTVPIGIAFGIVLVLIEGREYEVATFRNDLDYKDGRRPSRIAFTNAEEDAQRRDFTINGMFYNPLTEEILDFVGGQKDLEEKVIRAIGDPHARIREDRLRMIRAIRLACRFHFKIDPPTAHAIRQHAPELFPAVAIERVVQEMEKGLQFGKLRTMLIRMHEFGLLQVIFPELQGIDLEEIERRLEGTKHFPQNVPLIAFLLELFPGVQPDLCTSLKLSKMHSQFANSLAHTRELVSAEKENRRPVELAEWAHLYAHKFSNELLQIVAAHLDKRHRRAFLKTHEERQVLLQSEIERIRTHQPLITAADLTAAGIAPGKEMGRLLKEAERISINEQLNEKGLILRRLGLKT